MAVAAPGRPPKTAKIGKPKIMLSGGPGAGKTWFSLDFPSVFYIDSEGGAELNHYQDKLLNSGGRYFGREDGGADFEAVTKVVSWLKTNKHEYRTLVIDSFSKLFLTAAAVAEEKVGNDFGKDRKEASRPARKILTRLDALDMNVILICHSKAKWEGSGNDRTQNGTTFDAYEKMEYDLDLWLEVIKQGTSRKAIIRKSRLLGFPEQERFDLSYDAFAGRYGRDIIEEPSAPAAVCTAEEAAEIDRLISLRIDGAEFRTKTLEKYGIDKLADLPADAAIRALKYLNSKETNK